MSENKLFAEAYPELSQEWHTAYNNVLGLSIETVTEKSREWAYWICPKCGSVYRMTPQNRAAKKEHKKESCFTCRGRVQRHCFIV